MDTISDHKPLASELSNIIDPLRHLLFFNANYIIDFVRRQINRVAYDLARASILHTSPQLFHLLPSLY